MEPEPKNRYGLSRKTNIALAAIAGITTAADHWPAILAIGSLAHAALEAATRP